MATLLLWVGSFSAFGLGPTPFIHLWDSVDCVRWQDDLVGAEAAGRLAWSESCAPEFQFYYNLARTHKDSQGNPQLLYPVFGETTGMGELENPLGYFPAVSKPESIEECNLPSGYTLVGLCRPFLKP